MSGPWHLVFTKLDELVYLKGKYIASEMDKKYTEWS